MAEYIERNSAMKRILAIGDLNYDGMPAKIGTTHAALIIRNFPAADVAPVRHGRWEFVEQQFYMGGFINILRCSECENRVDREYRFCPNCGAEMDLEADHEAG